LQQQKYTAIKVCQTIHITYASLITSSNNQLVPEHGTQEDTNVRNDGDKTLFRKKTLTKLYFEH